MSAKSRAKRAAYLLDVVDYAYDLTADQGRQFTPTETANVQAVLVLAQAHLALADFYMRAGADEDDADATHDELIARQSRAILDEPPTQTSR